MIIYGKNPKSLCLPTVDPGVLQILRVLHPHSDYFWPSSSRLQIVWIELL